MTEIITIFTPDIGGYENVNIVEIMVQPDDVIEADASILTLETDKATMEIPSPHPGTIVELLVSVGHKISQGTPLAKLAVAKAEVINSQQENASQKELASENKTTVTSQPSITVASQPSINIDSNHSINVDSKHSITIDNNNSIYASPVVRRLASYLGIDLANINLTGSGPKQRILKQDLYNYAKQQATEIQNLTQGQKLGSGLGAESRPGLGFNLPTLPEIDFSQFGIINRQPLNRIKKLSGSYLHRNWVSIPHVTNFDQADLTELEQWRQLERQKLSAQNSKLKLTPLAFILPAVIRTLKEFPQFNASLSPDGSDLILKQYYHIGIAVDTPNGLVVPVLRNADSFGIFELAGQLADLSSQARDGKLGPQAMQGGSFTISSLGGIGGTNFTPIINAPEVAILGISKAEYKPVYDAASNGFVPRLMLPLALSYDHRVIDGAEAARFMASLVKRIAEPRTVLL